MSTDSFELLTLVQAEYTAGRGTYIKGKHIYASAAGIPKSFAPEAATGDKVAIIFMTEDSIEGVMSLTSPSIMRSSKACPELLTHAEACGRGAAW